MQTHYEIRKEDWVIAQGQDLGKLIDEASSYFEIQMLDNGEYGHGSVDVTVVDVEGDVEFPLEIKLYAERDTYADDVRSTYYFQQTGR